MSRRSSSALLFGLLCGAYTALNSGVSFAQNSNTATTTPSGTIAPVAKPKAPVAVEDTDSWRGKSVFQRSRSDYTNTPARAGSFKVMPSITLEENYDSNIYAVQDNSKDDFITLIKPLLTLESDWSRHALKFNASGDIAAFSDNNRENYTDYGLGASTRLDLFRETYLLGSASTSKLHEDRGSPDARTNTVNPTEYTQNNANLTFMRNLHKVSLKLEGDYTDYTFENSETGSGTIVRNNDRNRSEYKGIAQLGYEIIPEYQAFIRSALNERNYDSSVDQAGINRNSSGYEVVVGTALNLGGKTRGEVFAGYMEQDYEAAGLKDVGAAQFGGNILWNVTSLSSIKAGVLRGVQETSAVNSSSYISTMYSLALEHELLYNLLLGVSGSYSINEYETNSAVAREDEILGAGAEVRYLLNRNASVIGKYNYTNRDSNQVNQDYDRNIVTLGLKLAM